QDGVHRNTMTRQDGPSRRVTMCGFTTEKTPRSGMCITVDGSTVFRQEVGKKTDEIKPTSIRVDHANIPDVLKRLKLWVVWAYVRKDGRWTKLPFQPAMASEKYRDKTGWSLYAAKSNAPSTWSDYETVAAFHRSHPTLTDGIGVMLQEGLLGAD